MVSMVTCCQGFSSRLYDYMLSGFLKWCLWLHVVRVSQVVSMITCCQGFSSGLYDYMLSGFLKWSL